ncbi:MAG TPA: ATP synthase F1 subunit gamma [Syntrophorhabdaceae bacterium]|nr:ATP synthase F1 subunit gamma [Syntrophorhabdaceae bacterium]HOL05179.1 ATP synthase F1 subunit gamma [Syntrophorhabdaceae bacterium]HON84758.1 ATP synthase F1 subunit gamma [Syntrophorhabdaceae bacterium]HOT42108.1 ATP synthase F1 subunit gamma [Syntrophorhabdaceae bacterium]HPC66285.1 ATP synthase F1 subunit gamma [Syntrophorhabdaceae bacterium]
MATLRDIKRKINSINSTQTITRTMKMVSASKLRRAQDAYEKIRDYALKMENLVGRVISKLPKDVHPLLTEPEEVKKVLIVAIASDRGLCGGFNVNIGLAVENFVNQNREKYERIGVYVFGRKAKDYLSRRKVEILKERLDIKVASKDLADEVAAELIQLYRDGEFDKIYLLYTHFESAVKYVVKFEEFIPIKASAEEYEGDYLYEPDRDKIVEAIIPKFISTKIYYALVDSQTSEHAARMSAMENATKNCTEMVSYLTLVYNKRRQEGITSEMLDIVGGAEALRGT